VKNHHFGCEIGDHRTILSGTCTCNYLIYINCKYIWGNLTRIGRVLGRLDWPPTEHVLKKFVFESEGIGICNGKSESRSSRSSTGYFHFSACNLINTPQTMKTNLASSNSSKPFQKKTPPPSVFSNALYLLFP